MHTPSQSASFRDPAGSLGIVNGRVLRHVKGDAVGDLEAFLGSKTATEHIEKGDIVGTRALEPHENAPLLAALGWPDRDEAKLFEHDRIPFASFPYEWSPSMLAGAARATLDLHRALLDDGMGLKDATPYNILFDGTRPVFIDLLSVERRDPNDPVWTAYGQFIRTFLLPLLVQRDLGLHTADTLLTHRDGLEPQAVHRLVPRLRRLKSPYLSLVTLPTWLAARAEAQGDALYEKKRVRDPEQARFILGAITRRLERHLQRVEPSGKARSHWSGYMTTRDHYNDADAADKERFVGEALATVQPEWVLDAGCNTGHFSRLAARAGARVVAVDLDPVSVDVAWRRARDEGLDILPLVVDLARPTPAVGWANAESPSFLDRAHGRFDMVLMLALMHHLHVSERIPIDKIIDLAADMSRGHVVFEYVGPKDVKFRQLLRGRGHLHAGLTRASFEEAAERRFEVVTAQPLQGTDRVLYLLKRKSAARTPVVGASIAEHASETGPQVVA